MAGNYPTSSSKYSTNFGTGGHGHKDPKYSVNGGTGGRGGSGGLSGTGGLICGPRFNGVTPSNAEANLSEGASTESREAYYSGDCEIR